MIWKNELACFCLSMCWVRMKHREPTHKEFARLARIAFPDRYTTQLVLRCMRAVRSIEQMNIRFDTTEVNSTHDATLLTSSIWCACCDSPPSKDELQKYVMLWFPKLDEEEVGIKCQKLSSDLVDIYDWWFPKHLEYMRSDKKSVRRIIRRKRS